MSGCSPMAPRSSKVGEETFRLCKEHVDEIVLVDTDQLCAAIKDVFQDTRSILEPSGALSVAGAKAYVEREGLTGQTLVAVACGANMNFDRLRFVSERAEIGEQREAVFAVTIPEERGSFRRFCEAGRAAQRDRVQLPDRRPPAGACFRGHPDPAPRRRRHHRRRPARGRFRDPGPDRRRTGQAAHPPTCNRTEIYCAGEQAAMDHTLGWLAQSGGVSPALLRSHSYTAGRQPGGAPRFSRGQRA
jgi:hypothetical protein